MATAKSSRITNVQVPGEVPGEVPESEQQQGSSEGENQEVATDADPGLTETKQPETATDSASGATFDIEAIREQMRAEVRVELQDQIRAAQTVAGDPKGANSAVRGPLNYRAMRAKDIDPATLTAPVLTLDGYLCPPAPEKK